MEEMTTQKLPTRTNIFLVTGQSGPFEDKSSWLVAAYSDNNHAQKAQLFLEKLAQKLNKERNSTYSEEFRRDLEELKLHDPKAYYNEFIHYYVEPVLFVV